MTFNNLYELLGDNERLKALICNLSSGYIELPFIIKSTLEVLEDNNIYKGILSDKNRVSLCRMMDRYFNNCYDIYLDNVKLDNLLKYGCIEVYKVDALNGLRYATTNEIAQGVKGLIGENVYPAGEQEYKNLCLLAWTFNGANYNFRKAGYRLDYDDNGKVTTTFLNMIEMSAQHLLDMMDWVVVSDNFEHAVKKIRKVEKSHGYKYTSYEKDEITENITIKQLVLDVYNIFPRSSNNAEVRQALALAIKAHKYDKQLTPMEVSRLRELYDKHALLLDKSNKQAVNTALKEKCEKLLENKNDPLVKDNFAFKIIETLKSHNYTKCSEKQMQIIDKAYSKLFNDVPELENTNTTAAKVVSDEDIDFTLSSISDAIGSGTLWEEIPNG